MTTAHLGAGTGEPADRDEAVELLNRLLPAEPPPIQELLLDDGSAAPPDVVPRPVRHAITVVVPTRNEEGNIAPLVRRLGAALAGEAARVLFVDDSDDGTSLEVVRVAAGTDLTVDLLHRERDERQGGLGGAVLEGLRASRSPWAVVMDGDLQHPPELVPQLVAAGMRAHAEVVVASRKVPGGSSEGLATVGRALVSSSSTVLSKLVFPRNLRGISDPMSGFFALRLDAVDLDILRPRGFKILLELLARHGQLTKAEVAFTFGERLSGDSKASVREGLLFVKQLVRLWGSQTVARGLGSGVLQRGAGFATVGLTGLLVNMIVLWALADPSMLRLNYLMAAVMTTQISSSWNFVLVDNLVYRGTKRLTRLSRYLGFMVMSNTVLLLRIPLLALLVSVLGVHYLAANVLTLLLGYLVRFRSQERLTLTEDLS